jgi:HAD superfamily hydrolase (TIGR01459 family)
MQTPIPIVSSIADLAASAEAWIVDIWGVMHNGARAHPAAGAACREFRKRGGIVMLLSNAPRPFVNVVPHMTSLGVNTQAYNGGVTSGDATRDMIADWQGKRLLHIGPDRDMPLFEGYGVELSNADDADAIVCSGLYDDAKETPADYAGLLAGLARRRIPMICANPDILVERGEEIVYCAGALAADYEKLGGPVTYAGKPHAPIYDRTMREIARIKGREVPREKIICIGDGLETDLLGAYKAGFRSVFIASPIFVLEGLNDSVLEKLFAPRPFAPVAAMSALTW